MIDERYDRSADMRLLDLHREALGVPPRVIPTVSYIDEDDLADPPAIEADAPLQSGTILSATIDAQPRASLIPGALVTVSLAVTNDGGSPAGSVRLTLPLPAHASYRPGTLAIDSKVVADETALELIEKGAEIGDIAPGARRTIVMKILIEPGLNDIILSPHLIASSGAVLGLRAMRLTRAAGSQHTVAPDRPFYESDEAEHVSEPLGAAAPQPTITVLQPPEYPPAIHPVEKEKPVRPKPTAAAKPKPKPKLKAKPKPRAKPKALVSVEPPIAVEHLGVAAPQTAVEPLAAAPAPTGKSPVADAPRIVAVAAAPTVVERDIHVPSTTPLVPIVRAATLELPPKRLERPKIEVVRSPEGVLIAGRGGPILSVGVDGKRLATLTGLFAGTSLGMIAHYFLLNALAAKDPLPGDGFDGALASFVANQEQLLSRALIARRLGKTLAADALEAALPPFPPAVATHTGRLEIETPLAGQILLIRAFQTNEIAFLERMLANDTAAPFMRAAQLFVGLCASQSIVGSQQARQQTGSALTQYAALATAEISRIFLRAKLSGTPALFRPTDAAFDASARTVLAALGNSIA